MNSPSTSYTPSQAAQQLLDRISARKSLLAFTKYTNPRYAAAAHHALICDKLEAISRGEVKRLMLFMPPRHGKSELASRKFPAWYLGTKPEKQIIATSYGSDLADEFGREVRNLVAGLECRAVFPSLALREDSRAANRWNTTQGGTYVAAGVGSAIMGRGADCLLIDDPLRNREDADSDLTREKIWNWYTSTAYTRLMPGGAIVLIQTRWHHDDLAGRLLRVMAAGGEKWDVMAMPAINETGDALWPDWWPLDELERIKTTIGPRDWSALYQQEPMPEGGGEFMKDWLRYYTNKPTKTNNYIICDPANEKKKHSDYTCMWVIGLGEDANYYVLDCVRDRLGLVERANTLFRLHRQYKPIGVRYERYGIMADIEHMQYRMEREQYRFQIDEVAGQTSKNDRIRRLIPILSTKRLWMPETLHLTDHRGIVVDLTKIFREEELGAFPAGIHDDMLDSLSRIAEPEMPLTWPKPSVSRRTSDHRLGGASANAWMG